MKKHFAIMAVALLFIFFIVGCTNEKNLDGEDISGQKTMEELPEEYTVQMAIAAGDYVDVHGRISNEEKMTDFIHKVSNKEQASIRKVQVTVEGDPIITDFLYNGTKFFVTQDTRRDKFGRQSITTREFKNLITFDREVRWYFITDLNEITEDLYESGFEGEVLKYEAIEKEED